MKRKNEGESDMKKILLILGFILTTSLLAAMDYNVIGGIQGGALLIKDSNSEEYQSQSADYTFGLEVERKLKNNNRIGLGVKYQTAFDADSTTFGKSEIAKTIPVYLLGKVGKTHYFKGELGYSIAIEGNYIDKVESTFNKTVKLGNGLYAGVGCGYEKKKLFTELTYTVTTVNYVNHKNERYLYANNSLSLSLGYKF